MKNEQTAGDLLFEDFLQGQGGYDFTFEPDLHAELGVEIDTKPDYLVRWDDGLAVCEVKEFTTPAVERRLAEQGSIVASDKETFGPIREQLRAGAHRLRPLKGSGIPLVVVLTNPRHVWVGLDSWHIQHAVLGNPQIRITFERETGRSVSEEERAARDGVMLRERRYVSAVLAVHSAETAEVHETGDEHATPLPRSAFSGCARYGYLPGGLYGALEPTRARVGDSGFSG